MIVGYPTLDSLTSVHVGGVYAPTPTAPTPDVRNLATVSAQRGVRGVLHALKACPTTEHFTGGGRGSCN